MSVTELLVEPADTDDAFRGVPQPLQGALRERGFSELTSIQRAVLDAPIEGRNLRLTSQTGSGKTVALGFVLYPTIKSALREEARSAGEADARAGALPVALIIVPTRELANQVQAELKWLFATHREVTVGSVTGGTDVRTDQRKLRNPPTVLVGTPGRLLDHVRSRALDLSFVREVVLDEADQMLDMGFRDDLQALVEALPAERRSHLVSATFPPNVQQLARAFQTDPLFIEGSKLGAANADIEHVLHLVNLRDMYDALVNVLLANTGIRCLVFVQRRSDAASVAERLAEDGFAALPISGDLPQAQRTRTLAAFKHGSVEILVATDVAARGIHVDDIGVVIHMDFPREIETYTHRSGRTGRAGQKGQSVSLIVPQARRRVEAMLGRLRIAMDWQPLPTPKRIRRRMTKETRRILHARLDSAALPETTLQYAKELLAKTDAERLVTVLLEMAEKPLPTEPRDVEDASEPRPRAPSLGEKAWRGRPPPRERGDERGRGARPGAKGPIARGPKLVQRPKKRFGKPQRPLRPHKDEA